jgi:N-acetylmuramoyl-L-alanine amidase
MRYGAVRAFQRVLLLIIVLGLAAGALSVWGAARAGTGPGWLSRWLAPPQVLAGRHIGIVAGHREHDSGTVCADGLTEASVNEAIADGVVAALRRRGAQVDLLAEFDERLTNYQVDAFLSIHADSCQSELSGFKVASADDAHESASRRLGACLWQRYEQATGLARNLDTITDDMRLYHAFHQIAPGTPAAIIETGFMDKDRALLTDDHQRAVDGIVDGLECFLVPATPAP